MAVSVNPKPSDGPLNGNAPTAQLAIKVGNAGTVIGYFAQPGKPVVEILRGTLLPGQNRVVFPLPTPPAPPGSELRVVVKEAGNPSQVLIYRFA